MFFSQRTINCQGNNRLAPISLTIFMGLFTAFLSACDSGVVVGARTSSVGSLNDGNGQQNELSFCNRSSDAIAICPATDMAKIARDGPIVFEHADYDFSNGFLHLSAARNETIAFQLILHRTSEQTVSRIKLNTSSINATNSSAVIELPQSAFNAYYHPIDNAGYTWGPPTPVLPWPAEYPDALIPFGENCSTSAESINASSTNSFSPNAITRDTQLAIPATVGANQSIWIDTYIPKQTQPGTYDQTLTLNIDDVVAQLPIKLTIYDAELPDKPSIHAIGELYRTFNLEGAGVDIASQAWQRMAHCYQSLAHQHRMIFLDRMPSELDAEQLQIYANIIEPILDGSLFSADNGYIGPGANTPVSIWKTPWPQTINADSSVSLSEVAVASYKSKAQEWSKIAQDRGWLELEHFAYIFDEVDGPKNTGRANETQQQYFERVHQQMADVQSAIDAGATGLTIDLLWTSHSNPSIWRDNPALDLTDTIRLWAPNAAAADTQFLQERIDNGDKAWFYHNGHPAIGAHSINASGIEMRTWGNVGARYGFQGQLMWAVNLGSDDFPYRDPQYRPDEDRAGNGVLVYPGNQLDKIGYSKSPGPVPSMRLKAWRRGLQDAELFYLATSKNPQRAEELIRQQIPNALSEGETFASWSDNPGDWINYHKALLKAASTSAPTE